MGIFLGNSEPSKIFVGGSEVASVRAGDTKVRPKLSRFATQGPCPDGYHVPSSGEWYDIYNIGYSLGLGNGGDNYSSYLKLPYAGVRSYNTGNPGAQGTMGYYRANNKFYSDGNFLQIRSSGFNYYYTTAISNGINIRPFKNEPKIPTLSWTKLYGTSIEAGGIFWSSTDGLISLSSDGNTWITISDKNLGATESWNGNALTQNNCGNYYQWGNNYGFPYSGGITTSPNQVNASTYGPGNYYSSSTFITVNSWDSSNNANLRGGEDGNIPI